MIKVPSKLLPPRTQLRYVGLHSQGNRVSILEVRKHPDDGRAKPSIPFSPGWWCSGGGGLADSIIDAEDSPWVLHEWPSHTKDEVVSEIERVELRRLAGNLLKTIELLKHRRDYLRCEGQPERGGALDVRIRETEHVRNRLRSMVESLPEGPLEKFAREHPLFDDPIDGVYCGYGAKEGKPYTCPVHDPALHWDAWELMGTNYRRPRRAQRGLPE